MKSINSFQLSCKMTKQNKNACSYNIYLILGCAYQSVMSVHMKIINLQV